MLVRPVVAGGDALAPGDLLHQRELIFQRLPFLLSIWVDCKKWRHNICIMRIAASRLLHIGLARKAFKVSMDWDDNMGRLITHPALPWPCPCTPGRTNCMVRHLLKASRLCTCLYRWRSTFVLRGINTYVYAWRHILISLYMVMMMVMMNYENEPASTYWAVALIRPTLALVEIEVPIALTSTWKKHIHDICSLWSSLSTLTVTLSKTSWLKSMSLED